MNFDRVHDYLTNVTRSKNIELTVYDDRHLPAYNETMLMFNNAQMIIAPHGAGLSNILFSKPGTVILDLQCKAPWVRVCFRNLAFKLGMRYFSTTAITKDIGHRCDSSGIEVELTELFDVIRFVIDNVI